MKSQQNQDRQIEVHVRVTHDKYQVQEYMWDSMDDVYIVLNEIHEMQDQLKSHVMIKGQQQVSVENRYSLLRNLKHPLIVVHYQHGSHNLQLIEEIND